MSHLLRILLVRHGQTEWNATGRFVGRSDIPLDATGRVQVHRLSQAYRDTRFIATYSSPSSRAMETARAFGEPIPDADLLELHMGELDGLDGATFATRHPELAEAWRKDPSHLRLPSGETLAEAQTRGLRAIERIRAQHAGGGTVAVVSHQMLISATRCALAGHPLRRFRHYTLKNGAGIMLTWNGAWKEEA